jgi:hypothetical protein
MHCKAQGVRVDILTRHCCIMHHALNSRIWQAMFVYDVSSASHHAYVVHHELVDAAPTRRSEVREHRFRL